MSRRSPSRLEQNEGLVARGGPARPECHPEAPQFGSVRVVGAPDERSGIDLRGAHEGNPHGAPQPHTQPLRHRRRYLLAVPAQVLLAHLEAERRRSVPVPDDIAGGFQAGDRRIGGLDDTRLAVLDSELGGAQVVADRRREDLEGGRDILHQFGGVRRAAPLLDAPDNRVDDSPVGFVRPLPQSPLVLGDAHEERVRGEHTG